uniref:DDHD domain-containing protein n=1 Tax=Kalanchoe fedtschenkoi TaxID=63787 RepID=A0A7N0TRD4_KALFE
MAASGGAPRDEVDDLATDSLKNTPSNIQRLEAEIKQHKGREKYLAHTTSPSDGGDVRWYFCKVPLADNELPASVPRMEIVGKGEYFRFGMRDSLAIESSFLQREEELLSCWWKEYAECSIGPMEQPSSSNKSDPSKADARSALCSIEEERVGVPVKGGLYEVDLIRRHCFPVYWNGENRRVLRGHWFARKGALDWLPLREDVAEQLEFAYRCQVWHRRMFQPSGLYAARVELQGSAPGLHALFTGEDETWEAWLNVDASGLSSMITLRGNGIKLRRGYLASQSVKPTQDELRQQKEEEMDDYCSQVPVRHLVFMVHGIGQRLENSNLVDDVGNFRHITASLAERHLTPHQRGTQRVLYIPCQWRKGLKLSSEATVDKITLDGVRGLRVLLSATAHDVLYYMSPIYCQDIINSVSNQLNRLYLKFIQRNPGYDGKVSIYGHSLGSVLSYDILCHQENLSSPFPMDSWYQNHSKSGQRMENQSLISNSIVESEEMSSALIYRSVAGSCAIGMSAHSNALDPIVENDVSTIMDLSMSSSDESSAEGMNKNPCNYQIPDDPVPDSISSASRQTDNLDETGGIEFKATPVDESKPTAKETVDEAGDKDKIIQQMKEQIDFLKKQVSELEQISEQNLAIGKLSSGSEEAQTTLKLSAHCTSVTEDDGALKSYTPFIKYTKLEFKVDTFFAVGSPLGVFLALRNIRIGIGRGQDYWEEEKINEEMPACRRMINIFHPFDPVAYRLEPLVCKEYLTQRPVLIPYHKGGKRLHIMLQEFAEYIALQSQNFVDNINYLKAKVMTVCQSRNKENLDDVAETSEEKDERSYGSLMIERLSGCPGGRIDHVLQDKTFQHPYISAIGSHTNYWRDYDTALFMLRHLYEDIPEDAISPHESDQDVVKYNRRPLSWSDQREAASEEELPLTFSEPLLVRNFSRKAKKYLRKPT